MKTKYLIYTLLILSIYFSFTSCVIDELNTQVSINADKTAVAVNETVNFTMSGNAETYVIYTGDNGHDFANSYFRITNGKLIDQEDYVLTQDKLDTWKPILTAEINTWNATSSNPQLDAATILAGITTLVGKHYYKDTAANRLREIMPTFKTYSDCGVLVTTYFTNNSVLLAPPGGFSTGVTLDRYSLKYSYKFTTPGIYTVTLLGTKIGQKNYSGTGYIDNRTSSASEYNYDRNTASVTITVN